MRTLAAITIVIIGLMFAGQSFQKSNEENEVVNFALYYEPLCPSSRDFIENNLYSAYPVMKSFINVTLNPYGNAHRTKVDGHWKFRCQHGKNECELAKLTACSLYKLNQGDQVNLVACLSSIEGAEKCITDAHLNYSDILSCANGELGEELLAKYGEETDALNPPHTFVPYIVFNGVYSEDLEKSARLNLVETVCSLLHEKIKPLICRQELNESEDLIYLSFNKETESELNLRLN